MFNVKQYSHQNGLNGSGVFIVNFEHISHIVFLIISISELEKVRAEKKFDFFKIFFNEGKHSHKKRIVWKHGPNLPFYAVMLRTKLYQNSFFFTGDQNVSKSKSRAARTFNGPIFLPFYKIIVSFFSFFYQAVNKARSNCVIMGCNLSKEHKLTLSKTQNGDPNYIDRFFFTFCQELPVQKLGDRHPNTIELASWFMHVLCDFKTT